MPPAYVEVALLVGVHAIIFKLVVDKSFIMELFEIAVYLFDGVGIAFLFFLFDYLFKLINEVDRLS